MTLRSFTSDWRPDLVCAAVAMLGVPLAFDLPAALKLIFLVTGVGVASLAGPVSSLCLVCFSLSLAGTTVTIGSTEWSPLELALLTTGIAIAIPDAEMLADRKIAW